MAPDTLALAIAGVLAPGAIIAAVVNGRYQYRINQQTSLDKNRELDIRQKELDAKKDDANNALATQIREDLREEREALKSQVRDLNDKVTELGRKIEKLTRDIETHKDGRERAEARCHALEASDSEKTREIDHLKIQLDAALRAQDSYSVAATVRKRIEEESKGVAT